MLSVDPIHTLADARYDRLFALSQSSYDRVPSPQPMLPTIGRHGMTFEVGGVPWGCVDGALFQQSLTLLMHLLDYVHAHNLAIAAADPQAWTKTHLPVYDAVRSVDYPRYDDGTLAATVHPKIQGRDFVPLIPGDPVFLTMEGADVCFEQADQDRGETCCACMRPRRVRATSTRACALDACVRPLSGTRPRLRMASLPTARVDQASRVLQTLSSSMRPRTTRRGSPSWSDTAPSSPCMCSPTPAAASARRHPRDGVLVWASRARAHPPPPPPPAAGMTPSYMKACASERSQIHNPSDSRMVDRSDQQAAAKKGAGSGRAGCPCPS